MPWNKDGFPLTGTFLVYAVAYNALINYIAEISPLLKPPHVDFDARWLRIKYVNGPVHDTTARRVGNEYNLLESYDAEATLSALVLNDIKLYQHNHFGIERERTSFCPNPGTSTIPPKMESRFQVRMWREASL